MNTVRDFIADYSVAALNMDFATRKMLKVKSKQIDFPQDEKLYNQFLDDAAVELNQSAYDASRTYYRLLVYLNKTKSNEELNNEISSLYKIVQKNRRVVRNFDPKESTTINGKVPVEYAIEIKNGVDKEVEVLVDITRTYMYKQWKNAQKGN